MTCVAIIFISKMTNTY